MLTIIQKLFNLTVSIYHTHIYIYHPFVVWKFQWYVHGASCSSTRKWFEKRVKIWNLQVAKIRSLDMCVPCAPADAFFHHLPLEIAGLMLNSSYNIATRLKNETWKKVVVMQKKKRTNSTREEKCVMEMHRHVWLFVAFYEPPICNHDDGMHVSFITVYFIIFFHTDLASIVLWLCTHLKYL